MALEEEEEEEEEETMPRSAKTEFGMATSIEARLGEAGDHMIVAADARGSLLFAKLRMDVETLSRAML